MASSEDEMEVLVGYEDETEEKTEGKEEQKFDDKGKEEDVPESVKRIHSLLPTFAATRANPEIAYSDHLAQLMRTPLDGSTLKGVTLNTLGRELSMSGIHDLSRKGIQDTDRSAETDEEVTRRYARIVDGLVLSTNKHNLDYIFLQEVEASIIDKILLPMLQEKLGENWKFHISYEGLITCYNTSKLTPIEGKESYDNNTRVLNNFFIHNETGETINLHNSWGLFSPFPRNREKEYAPLLTPKLDDNGRMIRIVIGGDTNSREAPDEKEDTYAVEGGTNSILASGSEIEDANYRIATLDDEPRNIVTGAVPMAFHRRKGYPPEQQLGDYPDGGFYTDSEGNPRQIKTFTLDLATGEIVPAEKDRNNLSWIPLYRMVMCLSHFYKTTKIIGGETLSGYEDKLKKRMNDATIQVGMAATSMNDKAVSIRFPQKSEFAKNLKNIMSAYDGVQFEFIECTVEMRGFEVIFVPVRLIPILEMAIDWVFDKISLLSQIDAEIIRLNASQSAFFIVPPTGKIARLNDLKEAIINAPFNPEQNISSVIDAWEQEKVSLQNPLSGENETKTNADWLGMHRNKLRGIFLDENEKATTSKFLTKLTGGPK
jgi:hypothetical protein